MRAVQIGDYALLLAIDSTDEKEILKLSRSLGGLVDGVKIGASSLLACGTQIIKGVKELTNAPIVADLKVADIAFRNATEGGSGWSGTNSRIVEAAIRSGIDYVICHTVVGTSSIRECVDVAHGLGGRVLTLPFMTHEGAAIFFDQPLDLDYTTRQLDSESPAATRALLALGKRKKDESGWRSRTLTISDLILVLGEEYGVDGYIAPANIPEIMSDYRKVTRRFVLAPGIGRQGGKLEDVYRILGPRSAAAVGHAIYAAKDPVAACEELLLTRKRTIG